MITQPLSSHLGSYLSAPIGQNQWKSLSNDTGQRIPQRPVTLHSRKAE